MMIPNTPARPDRPLSVTLLMFGVLILASLNTARFVLAIDDWSFIWSLKGASPVYLAVSGLVWAVAGWVTLWGLWRGARWAARLTQIFTTAFLVFFWSERVFVFGQDGIAWPENGLFIFIVSIVLILFVFWSTTKAKSKQYFGVIDERTS